MLRIFAAIISMSATLSCSKSSFSNGSSDERDLAKISPCTDPVTPRFKKNIRELGYDCTYNEIVSRTFRSERDRTFRIDYGAFNGLDFALPEEGVSYPLRVEFELVRDKSARVWGFSIASDKALLSPYSVRLPASASTLLPVEKRDTMTLGLLNAAANTIRFSAESLTIDASDSIHLSSVHSGFISLVTIRTTSEPPKVYDIEPAHLLEDTPSVISLTYTDLEKDLATECQAKELTNLITVEPCACDSLGVCQITVQGSLNYFGEASLLVSVKAGAQSSNDGKVKLVIDPVDDAPVADDFDAGRIDEGETINIALPYHDVESHLASSCAILEAPQLDVINCTCVATTGACTARVKGKSGYSGATDFKFTVTANGLNSEPGTAQLLIDNIPVVSAFTTSAILEDIPTAISIPYSDANGHLAATCTISNLVNLLSPVACTCDGSGQCSATLTGDQDFNGSAQFTYTVTANGLTSAPAVATVPITAVDDAPVIQAQTFSINEDSTAVFTILYVDVDADKANQCTVTNRSNLNESIACACDAQGLCTWTAAATPANYFGSAGFDATVRSTTLTSAIRTLAVTVNPVDDAPITSDVSAANLNEDTDSPLITLAYTDIENDPATSCATSTLTNLSVVGSCTCAAGICSLRVRGTSNYFGPASLSFTVSSNGLTSNSSTLSLTIDPVDDAPTGTLNAPGISIFEDIESDFITLTYNDVENDLATSCALSNLNQVLETTICACAAGVCTVKVTGAPVNYFGNASFDYTVTANGLTSIPKAVSFSIISQDDPPVANDFSPAAFDEDVQSIITLDYTDVEGDKATTCSVNPTNANISVTTPCACTNGVCTVGITGALNYFGAAAFTFSVVANGQSSNTATASLTISAVDDAPVAIDISPANFDEEASSTVTMSYGSAYTDVESDLATSCTISALVKVTVTTGCSCSAGTCTVGVTGVLNQYGSASFGFSVTSNGKTSNVATATFTLNPVNDVPVVESFSNNTLLEDVEKILTIPYTEYDGEIASSCNISNLSNITETTPCACNGAGVCTVGVKGLLNYNGSASFDFTVTVGADTSNVATASLTIQAVDDPPVADDISPAAFDEDIQSIITLSYSDVEGDQATSCSIQSLTNVTVTTACACIAGVCTVGVTGTLNYFGAASFTYNVSSNGLSSNSATATLTINPVDDAPVANNFSAGPFLEETEAIVTLSYTDAESHQASSCSITPSANITETTPCSCSAGVCTVGITGVLNYHGTTNFTFSVIANGLSSNTATATITISNVDDPPVVPASIDMGSILEDVLTTIALGYSDADGDLATSCAVTDHSNLISPTTCTCTDGVCSAQIQGTLNYFGPASFKYTVTALGAVSNSGLVTLTIDPVDDPPVAENISPAAFNEDEDSPWINLVYTDVENDLATSCALTDLVKVSIVAPCECSAGLCRVKVRGSPEHTNGAASFNYTVTANGATSNSANASLTITPVNDPPETYDPETATTILEDVEGFVTLTYREHDGEKATSCAIVATVNVTVTTPCACDGAGVCRVGVTGSPLHKNGAASIDFTVSVGADISNTSTAAINITPVDDDPEANNFSTNFDEDVISEITLDYIDVDGDQATTCTVSGLVNVTVTTGCACSAGICTVSVKGSPLHYNGSASFLFRVTAAGKLSNQATATLTINPVNDPPVLNTNLAFTVQFQSENNTIPLSKLSSSDVDDSTSNIIYTVTTSTARGTLTKSGVPLGNGDTFTQANLASGVVKYTHTAGDYTSDTFQFSVADDDTAYATLATNASPATFVINITPQEINCASYTNSTNYNEVGLGTSVAPYQICTALQIANIADNCNSSTNTACALHFRLQGDINMQDITGFTMIGSLSNAFTGSFNGNGREISNLTAGNGSSTYAGFFRYVGSGAIISNLIVKGTIQGGSYVGGLVGYNIGTLSSVGFDGSVTSATNGAAVGGLVGYHAGTIQNAFAKGSVTASGSTNKAGGLVGSVATASVSTSYSNAVVSSSSQSGGFIGTSSSGTYSENFWDSTLSGKANAYNGVGGSVTDITGLTTANSKLKASYTGAWNFTTVWRGYDYVSAPRLIFEPLLMDCVAAGSHFYDTNGNGSYDACYYPAYASCEAGAGMGIDSNLDGVLDGCLFLSADNQSCSATCSANSSLTVYSDAQTSRVAGKTSLCKFAADKLASPNTNYTFQSHASTIFSSGANQMSNTGCMRSDNPDGRFFEYSFIITTTGASGISATAPNATHPFIQNEGGKIRRVCGCDTP